MYYKNQLSQKQQDMLQPFWNEFLLDTSHLELKRTACVEKMCAWLRIQKRRPHQLQRKASSSEAEREEQSQYARWAKVRSLYRRNQLSPKQLNMLQPFLNELLLDTSQAELRQTACVEQLCSWLRIHKRRPRPIRSKACLNEAEREEQLQYARWTKVRNMQRRDQLGQKQLAVLQPFASEIGVPRTNWLESLCAWLNLHGRRPRCFQVSIGLAQVAS